MVGEEEHEQDDQRFNHTTNEPTKSKAMADSKHTAKGPKAKRKASATPPPLPTPAPPKKQKLPTIKKVKLANNNTSTSSSTVVVDTAAVLPVLPLGGKPTQDGVRKTMIGATDIDLSNKSIYEEIFSKTVRFAVVFLSVSYSCFCRVKEMGGRHGLGATDGPRRKKDGKN